MFDRFTRWVANLFTAEPVVPLGGDREPEEIHPDLPVETAAGIIPPIEPPEPPGDEH